MIFFVCPPSGSIDSIFNRELRCENTWLLNYGIFCHIIQFFRFTPMDRNARKFRQKNIFRSQRGGQEQQYYSLFAPDTYSAFGSSLSRFILLKSFFIFYFFVASAYNMCTSFMKAKNRLCNYSIACKIALFVVCIIFKVKEPFSSFAVFKGLFSLGSRQFVGASGFGLGPLLIFEQSASIVAKRSKNTKKIYFLKRRRETNLFGRLYGEESNFLPRTNYALYQVSTSIIFQLSTEIYTEYGIK
jgi:hypothetical protein